MFFRRTISTGGTRASVIRALLCLALLVGANLPAFGPALLAEIQGLVSADTLMLCRKSATIPTNVR
jgi:hypothetical protein